MAKHFDLVTALLRLGCKSTSSKLILGSVYVGQRDTTQFIGSLILFLDSLLLPALFFWLDEIDEYCWCLAGGMVFSLKSTQHTPSVS